jgi:hypothetical protein
MGGTAQQRGSGQSDPESQSEMWCHAEEKISNWPVVSNIDIGYFVISGWISQAEEWPSL